MVHFPGIIQLLKSLTEAFAAITSGAALFSRELTFFFLKKRSRKRLILV